MSFEVSIVVCTYNRCHFLQRFLQSALKLNRPLHTSWELIIVDNNSDDGTPKLVKGLQTKFDNLRYIFEGRQGKGYALNTGIENANADTIVFTDDDVTLHKNWLIEYCKAFSEQKEFDWFGGKVEPQWLNGEPSWLSTGQNRSYFKGYFVWYEIDNTSRAYRGDDGLPFGASMAIRKRVFTEAGKFREDIGVRGKIRGAGMDVEMIERACNHGFHGYYVHSAVCLHHLDKKRLRLKSFFIFGIGRGINHYKLENERVNGSIIRSISQLMRGFAQLIKGNGDNFRITLINAGIEIGRLVARFSK